MSSSVTGCECLIETAEVAARELLEVAHELDGDRPVEPVAGDEVVADGIGRSLAEHGPAGIARHEAGESEHDEHDPEQDGDRDEDPTKDELGHGWGSSPPGGGSA